MINSNVPVVVVTPAEIRGPGFWKKGAPKAMLLSQLVELRKSGDVLWQYASVDIPIHGPLSLERAMEIASYEGCEPQEFGWGAYWSQEPEVAKLLVDFLLREGLYPKGGDVEEKNSGGVTTVTTRTTFPNGRTAVHVRKDTEQPAFQYADNWTV